MCNDALELTCTTENNSPAVRPEFVDISLWIYHCGYIIVDISLNIPTEESITEGEESETEED